MGTVVSLERYREARQGRVRTDGELGRLDVAVTRLEPLVRRRADRLTATIERELQAIARSVTAGLPAEAALRAERLAGLLEHPAASN
jgi:hypothetical protein